MLIAKKFIEELGEQELWPVIHNCAPLVQTSGWTAKKYFSKFYKDSLLFPAFVTIKDHEGMMYIPLGKAKAMAGEVFTNYLKDPRLFEKMQKERKIREKNLELAYKKMNKEYFDNVSQSELKEDLKKLKDDAWYYNASVFFSTGFDKIICEKVLNNQSLSLSEELWNKSSVPPIPSFEKRHGWKVAELMLENKDLNALSEDCQYFFASYGYVPDFSLIPSLLKENYASYVVKEGYSTVEKEKKELELKSKKFNKWVNSLPEKEKNIASFLSFVISVRDERKDYLLIITTLTYRAAVHLLRKAGLSESLAPYLLYDEILEGEGYLRSNAEKIKSRVNGFDVFCSYGGDYEVQYGKSEENIALIEEFYSNQNKISSLNVSEIKGVIGFKGKVKGKVRIIRNIVKESTNFKSGEILVAGMTRPEYVRLMKKAAAIVTDEGGITCHAAIVSRELKKPCIIGTKIATKVLKDGDLVEVNANNGVVRILEKEK